MRYLTTVERNKLETVFEIASKFFGSLVPSNEGIYLQFPCIDTKQGFIQEATSKLAGVVKIIKSGSNRVEVLV
jgi:hypothetical protein